MLDAAKKLATRMRGYGDRKTRSANVERLLVKNFGHANLVKENSAAFYSNYDQINWGGGDQHEETSKKAGQSHQDQAESQEVSRKGARS